MNAMEEKPLRILGVYAHPDDESFCAGGTLAKYTRQGAEALVFSATRGEAGQIRDARAANRRNLGVIREQEQLRACQRLGVQQVVCRDYGDGKLQDVPRQILVEEVVRLLRSFRPDVILTFGDDGAYGHPDHVAIGAAADEAFHAASDASQFPDHMVQGMAPHQAKCLFHSYFPRNRRLLLDHLVRWLKSMDRRFFGTLDYINGLLFFADESTSLGYSSDHVHVAWYPPGFYILEQGEPPSSLYLLLSGVVDVYQEQADGQLVKVNELGQGAFFGEDGIAIGKPRNAHVVAREGVACLVFSPGAPTAFAGRGTEARYATVGLQVENPLLASTCIDVSEYIPQKIAAVSAYRTQYPITEDMFPPDMLRDLMGKEYFIRVYPAPEMETELMPAPPIASKSS
jgi:LmbE family N-acetylglucosaminyl deacetylase